MADAIKKALNRIQQLSKLEKVADQEEATPQSASVARQLIGRLTQQRPASQTTDVSPLFALASPSVGQRLLQATRRPETQEQRMSQAAGLELALTKARGASGLSAGVPQSIIDQFKQRGINEAEIRQLAAQNPKQLIPTLQRLANARRPSDKQINDIQELDDTLLKVDYAMKNFDPSHLSLTNIALDAAGTLGRRAMDPETASWRSIVGQMEDAYRKAITGAQASVREISLLRRNIPNKSDSPAVFQEKAQVFRDVLGNVRKRTIDKMQGQGKFVEPFLSDEVQERVQEQPSAAAEMVSVISPDGQRGRIPAANLEQALASGFRRAE